MDILDLVHAEASASARPFACEHDNCVKTFSRRSDLQRHSRIHSNDRPFLCDWPKCTRDFIQRSALTVHYRVHTGDRPHKCEYEGCDKAFSDSSSLARHRRIHTGKRPYKCHVPSCQKTFCRKVTLTKHIKRNHPPGSGEDLDHLPETYDNAPMTPSSTQSTPSDYGDDDASYISPDGSFVTPSRRSYRLPPTPQTSPYHLRSVPPAKTGYSEVAECSDEGASSLNLDHLHIDAMRRQHLQRRESGEAAYMTPPPQRKPHMPELYPVPISSACEFLDCSFTFAHQHGGETYCTPTVVHPTDLHSSPMRLSQSHPERRFIPPPMPMTPQSHRHQPYLASPYTPALSSSSYASSFSPFSTPSSSHHEHDMPAFSPNTELSSCSPYTGSYRRRASSTSALDVPTFSQGLGISFDESAPRALSDYGDSHPSDYLHSGTATMAPPASPTFRRQRRISSFSFPGAQHLASLETRPRESFSSFITHHLDQMEEQASLEQSCMF